MNAARDGDNQGSVVDFAVQLQVMVIVLLFAALWWFESRLDKIEANANQAAESVENIEELIEPFLKDKTSWQQLQNPLTERLGQ
jgi:hypothetical protein